MNQQPSPAALERLTLLQTKVTDEGLETLSRGLKTLRLVIFLHVALFQLFFRYLDVRGSMVSEEGVSAFKSDNKDCEVIS